MTGHHGREVIMVTSVPGDFSKTGLVTLTPGRRCWPPEPAGSAQQQLTGCPSTAGLGRASEKLSRDCKSTSIQTLLGLAGKRGQNSCPTAPLEVPGASPAQPLPPHCDSHPHPSEGGDCEPLVPPDADRKSFHRPSAADEH